MNLIEKWISLSQSRIHTHRRWFNHFIQSRYDFIIIILPQEFHHHHHHHTNQWLNESESKKKKLWIVNMNLYREKKNTKNISRARIYIDYNLIIIIIFSRIKNHQLHTHTLILFNFHRNHQNIYWKLTPKHEKWIVSKTKNKIIHYKLIFKQIFFSLNVKCETFWWFHFISYFSSQIIHILNWKMTYLFEWIAKKFLWYLAQANDKFFFWPFFCAFHIQIEMSCVCVLSKSERKTETRFIWNCNKITHTHRNREYKKNSLAHPHKN